MSFAVTKENIAFGPNCLVTGGAGFVGTLLIQRLLDLGLHLRSFDIGAPEIEHANLEVMTGDIRNADQVAKACAGIDTVFHTAAVICLLGTYRKSIRDNVWSINVTGTEILLAEAQKAGVKHFVHTSSHNVFMDRELEDASDNERYAERYLDLYTETKIAAEKAVLGADRKGGMRTAAIRPGGIWGPGKRSVLVNKTVEQLVAGKFLVTLGDPTAKTDCSHVQNVCDGEILAAQKLVEDPETVGGQGYSITDGEPFNQLRWIQPLVEMMGYKFPTLNLPGAPFYVIAILLEYIHLLGGPEPALTRSAIWKLTKNYYFSLKKAEKELGYKPRVGREDGMADVLPFANAYAAQLKGNAA